MLHPHAAPPCSDSHAAPPCCTPMLHPHAAPLCSAHVRSSLMYVPRHTIPINNAPLT